MHDGFAGGAFLDTAGGLIGITTAAAIRGLGVVIPASIAWKTAAGVLEHGSLKRGYLGLAGQPVRLAATASATRSAARKRCSSSASRPAAPPRRRACWSATCCSNSTATPSTRRNDLLDLLRGSRRASGGAAAAARRHARRKLGVTVGERPAD